MTAVDRYYVCQVSGGSLITGRHGVSFDILDRYDCHRQVYSDHGGRQDSIHRRRRLLRQEFERLNGLELCAD